MAIITELNCNLREAVHVKYLDGNFFSQDVYGNAIRVIVMDGDEPATLAGTVSGTAIREDGSTVALTDSRIDENVATVVLPAAAYAVPGVLAITIKISDTNTVTTLAYVVANVYRTSTDTVVDPGTIIPSITTLIEQIAEAVASIPADYSSLWAALAETFNASKSGGYAVGEYVTYDGGLYRFKNAHTGSWSSSDVDAVNLGSGIAKNASDISDLKSALDDVTEQTRNLWVWGDKTVTGSEYIIHNDGEIPAGTYTISAEIERETQGNCRIYFYKDRYATADLLANPYLASGSRNSATFTLNEPAHIVFIASGTSPSSTATATWKNVQLETGSTATPYIEPFSAVDFISRENITNIESTYFTNRGNLVDLGYTALSDCVKSGWYGFGNSQVSVITDLPDDFGNVAGALLVLNGAFNNTRLQIIFNGSSTLMHDKFWYRILFSNEYTGWIRASRNMYTMEYQGFVSVLGLTSIKQIDTAGWYGFPGRYSSSITDLPTNWTGSAGSIEIVRPAYGGLNYRLIRLTDAYGNIWMCLMNGTTVYTDWVLICGPLKDSEIGFYALQGKNVAIIGDSISTNGNYSASNPLGNVPEIIISQEDIDANIQLKAYVTYYDIGTVLNGSVTIDGVTTTGHTIVSDDVGKEISFIPVSSDVTTPPKMIGVPSNYNPASRVVWWEVLKNAFGFNPIPVCWSGSSISSHEGNDTNYKTSYAWHDAQIRKCGIRTPGTTGFDAETGKINRTPPDAIFIYRGTNDMTHSPYARLTAGYFDNYNWQYPESDIVDTNKYGYKEALCLTIKKLRDTYPNAKIFLCTLNVFKRVHYDHFPTNNGLYSLPQINDAIREVADFMGCDVISFDRDGITFENCYSEGYITDSATAPTHPSNKGHKAMALKAIADIKAKYSSMT